MTDIRGNRFLFPFYLITFNTQLVLLVLLVVCTYNIKRSQRGGKIIEMLAVTLITFEAQRLHWRMQTILWWLPECINL